MLPAAAWIDSPKTNKSCPASLQKFLEVTNVLLERPNLNSTHLFRADILFDSANQLETIAAIQDRYDLQTSNNSTEDHKAAVRHDGHNTSDTNTNSAFAVPIASRSPADGLEWRRTIVRRLIPRKPQLDKPLEQSCYVYQTGSALDTSIQQACVIYVAHVISEEEMPWYHPTVRALAYLYTENGTLSARISMHMLLFRITDKVPERLERTLQSLSKTMVRLMNMTSIPNADNGSTTGASFSLNDKPFISRASMFRDTIIPQHVVQTTYSRLKREYATDLITRWVEKTDPSKHVFEDLSIAAFLIELWKWMYAKTEFPGFVDIACGNGVLVYILIQEGYRGSGFDARKRQTWEILGLGDRLQEKTCIPKPFLNCTTSTNSRILEGVAIHDGTFQPGTFVISNHADELTLWTPILAALSCPHSPLPFLAIPCCSHALDGSRHRFTLKDLQVPTNKDHATVDVNKPAAEEEEEEEEQPCSGDLKALRMLKAKAASHGDDKSAYACLTRKTVLVAEQLGYDIEQTLMRIPSTRNIGIVGNRKRFRKNAAVVQHEEHAAIDQIGKLSVADHEILSIPITIQNLLERECAAKSGIPTSAEKWIERTVKLRVGAGRGKVNLRGRKEAGSEGTE